jgi:hypothetical protein
MYSPCLVIVRGTDRCCRARPAGMEVKGKPLPPSSTAAKLSGVPMVWTMVAMILGLAMTSYG